MAEELVPLSMFLGLTVVFCFLIWFRYRARREMQETFRMALDKGQELTPEIIDRLGNPKPSPDRDLRVGIIWLSLAAGLVFGLTLTRQHAGDGGGQRGLAVVCATALSGWLLPSVSHCVVSPYRTTVATRSAASWPVRHSPSRLVLRTCFCTALLTAASSGTAIDARRRGSSTCCASGVRTGQRGIR